MEYKIINIQLDKQKLNKLNKQITWTAKHLKNIKSMNANQKNVAIQIIKALVTITTAYLTAAYKCT